MPSFVRWNVAEYGLPISLLEELLLDHQQNFTLSFNREISKSWSKILAKALLLAGFAAIVVADPAPQASLNYPTNSAEASSFLASESALASVLSLIPTLPISVESVLEIAIPTSIITGCQTTTPAWYQSLPPNVKSAITSYESALESWYTAHASQLGLTTTGWANICAVTGSAATTRGATATGGMTTSTSKAAAPHVMGAVGAGFTGIFGFLGVMAAL